MCNRRIANQLILWNKVDGTSLPGLPALLPDAPVPALAIRPRYEFLDEALTGILELHPAATSCPPLTAARLADWAALLGGSRTRACLFYQMGFSVEDVLLRDTCQWRHFRGAPAAPLPAAAGLGRPLTAWTYMTGWPAWLVPLA